MVIIVEMDPLTCLQIQDEAVCIPRGAYTIEKGLNPTILPTALGKGKPGYLTLV